jgi:hypothetical protein
MKGKALALIVILVVSLAATVPALADAPAVGSVVAGESVPGVALGDSRAQVEAAYGQPYYCQSYAIPDDFAACAYRVEGGGLVSIRYRGADGGYANNSPDDKTVYAGWGEGTPGWTTEEGINTALAKADPDAVIAAYPDAEVSYLYPGFVERVVDWLQGIEVKWSYDPYTGFIHVTMNIFEPLLSLPTAAETHVETIALAAERDRGIRKLRAWVQILDEYGQPASGSFVNATWTLPDGSTQAVYDEFAGAAGVAFFEFHAPKGRSARGVYTLRIDDVMYEGHTFDAAGSILMDSVYIK